MWGVVANILVYKFSNRKWNTHHNLHNIIPHIHVNEIKSKVQNAQNFFILLAWKHFLIKKINTAPRVL